MKLEQEMPLGDYQIEAYDAIKSELQVNKKKYQHSLIVQVNTQPVQWRPRQFTELSVEDFLFIANLSVGSPELTKPDLVLVGTGNSHQFVAPQLYQALINQHIAVECMSTAAACRTFTALNTEGRAVLAALLL